MSEPPAPATGRAANWTSDDCLTASYGVALERLGRQPLLLGATWGFRFDRERANRSAWPIEGLRPGRLPDQDELTEFGIDVQVVHHASPPAASAWARDRLSLSNDHTIVLEVDGFHLPHLDYCFGRHHLMHRVAVVGVDGDRARVIDAQRELRTDEWLPVAVLHAAMDHSFAEWPPNTTMELVRSAASVGSCRPDHDLMRDALVRSADAYLDGGRLALEAAATALRDGPVVCADSQTVEHLTVTNHVRRIMSQSGLASRTLAWAADALSAPQLHGAAEDMALVARQWTLVFNVLFFRHASDGARIFPRIAHRLQRVAELQTVVALGVSGALAGATAD